LGQHRRHAGHHTILPAMIVVLAVVAAVIWIAVVTGLPDRVPPLGLAPLRRRRPPVDDVYTAWFNANRRCGEALRAWREAAPTARPDAYRTYLAELELEAAAAAELELHAMAPAA
jgi:hypothetical protein